MFSLAFLKPASAVNVKKELKTEGAPHYSRCHEHDRPIARSTVRYPGKNLASKVKSDLGITMFPSSPANVSVTLCSPSSICSNRSRPAMAHCGCAIGASNARNASNVPMMFSFPVLRLRVAERENFKLHEQPYSNG
jgi:hypothetical protein